MVTHRLSAPALSRETRKASRRRYNGLIPPEKPFPSSQPELLIRVGDAALLEFSTSQALSPGTLGMKHLPSCISPPALPYPKTSRSSKRIASGFLYPRPGISPYGAPACLMFPADHRPPPLKEVNPLLTIFSSRGPKKPYDSFGTSLRSEFLPA